MDETKRSFFKNAFLEIARDTVSAFQEGVNEVKHREDSEQFFQSYESSYALTLAYPDDILLETARMAGIETEGRDKRDIMKELFEKKGGF
ncbi:MAG: hypothetical protein QG577_1588 [Thermodesulfobacteriota bacterium]|jgi:hypothetical protein|nr:hypothetical protein [Thermodesulfobacteriota bacterium]